MARQGGDFVQNQFIQGLISEASGLNFPDKAVIETWNTRYNKTGEVTRRFGMAYENDTYYTASDGTAGVSKSYVWRSAGTDQTSTLLVVQFGGYLVFAAPDASGDFTTGVKSFSVHLVDYLAAGQSGDPAKRECSFAAGFGKLYVANGYCDPIMITYDPATDTITVEKLEVKVRDVKGIDDGLEVGEHPSTLSDTHRYNLYNQGWYPNQPVAQGNDSHNAIAPDPLYAWANVGFQYHYGYPSNADIWWVYKSPNPDGNATLNSGGIGRVNLGTSQAPKGHYIYSAWDIDRSATSGIAGLDGESTNGERPTAACFFAGRLWLAGVNAEGYFDKIYYSQVVEDPKFSGNCYQVNDPTNEVFSDLLETDGGSLRVSGANKITALFQAGQALIVLATNGIWTITGSGADGTGFVATSFAINRISSTGLLQPTSLVDVQGTPYWWNLDGIWRINANGQSNLALSAESVTVNTIQSFFQSTIPANSRVYAQGAYNPLSNIIQWVWKSETSEGVYDSYRYDRILELNLITGAIYPFKWNIDDQYVSSIFCATDISVQSYQERQVSDDSVLVTDSSVAVTSEVLINESFESAIFKYVINLNTNVDDITVTGGGGGGGETTTVYNSVKLLGDSLPAPSSDVYISEDLTTMKLYTALSSGTDYFYNWTLDPSASSVINSTGSAATWTKNGIDGGIQNIDNFFWDYKSRLFAQPGGDDTPTHAGLYEQRSHSINLKKFLFNSAVMGEFVGYIGLTLDWFAPSTNWPDPYYSPTGSVLWQYAPVYLDGQHVDIHSSTDVRSLVPIPNAYAVTGFYMVSTLSVQYATRGTTGTKVNIDTRDGTGVTGTAFATSSGDLIVRADNGFFKYDNTLTLLASNLVHGSTFNSNAIAMFGTTFTDATHGECFWFSDYDTITSTMTYYLMKVSDLSIVDSTDATGFQDPGINTAIWWIPDLGSTPGNGGGVWFRYAGIGSNRTYYLDGKIVTVDGGGGGGGGGGGDSDPIGLAFAQETDDTYYDWVAKYGANTKDYDSYFTSGAMVHGEGQKTQQLEYITVFGKTVPTGSAFVRAKWDWSNSANSGKWSTEQQVYTINRDNRDVSRKRLMLRGQGPALQLSFRSESGKPFNIIGWSTTESVDAHT